MQQTKYLAALFAAVFVLGAGLVFYATMSERTSSTDTTNTTDVSQENSIRGPGYTITNIPIPELEKLMPDLSRKVVFSDSVPLELRSQIEAKVKALAASLTEDPSRSEDWFNLAILYHIANDYDGAKEIWEFLVRVAPQDTTAYDNLGKLYHFSLKDYPKAEQYFKQSISVNPNLLTPYHELFDLYRYSYKTNTSAAIDILNQAMERFPEDVGLYVLLGEYHRDRGNVPAAREAYTKAVDLARAVNDIVLVDAIGEELSRLPQ
ncbi:MAG: tetratricopeptide repeat protein [bacterium]|nr:tetratricopeptide repeat protein [bacterium]